MCALPRLVASILTAFFWYFDANDNNCCGGEAEPVAEDLHARLAELLKRYDVNQYAASVKIFALKP